MEVVGIRVLRGPNIWATIPVLEVQVHLGRLRDSSSSSIPCFIDRLTTWLPSLAGNRSADGFLEQLREGTNLARVLERVTLELQSLAGTDVRFGQTTEKPSEPGTYQVAVEYEHEVLARDCLGVARELCLAAVEARPFEIQRTINRLRELEYDLRLGGGTAAIVRAARARDIPVCQLDSEDRRMYLLGQGTRQQRIWSAVTGQTAVIAERISQDKELAKGLLRAAGVPVPKGRPVKDAEDAWEAARTIGVPVVIKPRNGELGEGVGLFLTTREQVLDGYAAAQAISADVIVEKFAPGVHHRLLIIGYRLIAAVRRDPPLVVGDGLRTVSELIEEANRDPRRGKDNSHTLCAILFDETAVAVLAEQGYQPDSIPPPGTRVLIRRHSHIRDGGTVTDVTDLVAPEVAARAIDATRVIGLDVAGLDVMAEDISRPLEEQGGVIVEVNSRPGLNVHLERWTGTSRPVGEAIVDLLFRVGESGRIPIVAITGTRGKTTTARLIAFLLAYAGRTVGMSCGDGLSLAGRRIGMGGDSDLERSRSVLMNPLVETAVLETTREGILSEGLGFDRCDVAVVTCIAPGAELPQTERGLVRVVNPGGAAVLRAADPRAAELAEHCPGSVIYFAQDDGDPLIARHRAGGGRAVMVRNGSILLAKGDREEMLILDRIPGLPVENVLAAVAACWALGMTGDALAASLRLPGIVDAGQEASSQIAFQQPP